MRSIDDQPLRNAARLDAALRAQRGKALGIAGVQAHRVAALAEVGRRSAAAMAGAEHRNRFHCHFAFRVRKWDGRESWAA